MGEFRKRILRPLSFPLIAAVFVATYPERVSELILFNGQIKPWIKPDMRRSIDAYVNDHWGEGGSITPEAASALAKLRSPNGSPALSTKAGARRWRLSLLEFQANRNGAGDIIAPRDLGRHRRSELTMKSVAQP